MVGRTGFEPVKAEPTDLQSVPFDRSGISPLSKKFQLKMRLSATVHYNDNKNRYFAKYFNIFDVFF